MVTSFRVSDCGLVLSLGSDPSVSESELEVSTLVERDIALKNPPYGNFSLRTNYFSDRFRLLSRLEFGLGIYQNLTHYPF